MELMFIPEGTFKMGSFGNGRYENDMPRHEVTLTNPFYMAKYAVTQEQWRVVMGRSEGASSRAIPSVARWIIRG
ncbi:MAG: hypothetical protein EBT02_04440 [Planctomycetia bacterium]|nr:hypothetical protein [Planctomycetia bacterium]